MNADNLFSQLFITFFDASHAHGPQKHPSMILIHPIPLMSIIPYSLQTSWTTTNMWF